MGKTARAGDMLLAISRRETPRYETPSPARGGVGRRRRSTGWGHRPGYRPTPTLPHKQGAAHFHEQAA